MTQHTLSPWKTKDQWGYIKVHSADKGVCVVHGLDSKSRANANLLAAAPELLLALEYLLEDHKRMFPEAHPHSAIKWDECAEVSFTQKTIAKAKGVSK
jgi:hypothetical protein